MSALETLLPAGWPRPSGYADGVAIAQGSRLIHVAGQIAWNEKREVVGGDDMAAQVKQALANVVAVVRAGGGRPEDIASMTVYVTSVERYRAALAPIGAAWREVMGKHYPAMALVQVAGLFEPGTLVEIQAVAAVPAPTKAPSGAKARIADALRKSLGGGA